jgi:hypothetical protein
MSHSSLLNLITTIHSISSHCIRADETQNTGQLSIQTDNEAVLYTQNAWQFYIKRFVVDFKGFLKLYSEYKY